MASNNLSSRSISPRFLDLLRDGNKAMSMATTLYDASCDLTKDRQVRKHCRNSAIGLYRHALELRPSPHPDRHVSLYMLGLALRARFREEGQKNDLDEAIVLYGDALKLQPLQHPERSTYLDSCAKALCARFNHQGKQKDLTEAISFYKKALERLPSPHSRRASLLTGLGTALQTSFDHKGQIDDLKNAISLHRQALELQLTGDSPARSLCLNNLAGALLTEFRQTAQPRCLDEAILLYRKAVLPPHLAAQSSSQAAVLDNLAHSLRNRFDKTHQRRDLDEAVSLHRQALALRPPPHPDRSVSLTNLGQTLQTVFAQGGQQRDLDEAITLHREALTMQSSQHRHRSQSFTNLGNALRTRFDHRGKQEDLKDAIKAHREALKLQPHSHPDRSTSLSNLGDALATHYAQNGGQERDLEEAITLYRQALELEPPPHPGRSISLGNLAKALIHRFAQMGQQGDVDEAISLLRQALELRAPMHSKRSDALASLASALQSRVIHKDQRQSDLDEAVDLHRQALQLRPPPHPDRPHSLNNLALSLQERFRQGSKRCDLDEAIELYREAIKQHSPEAYYHQSASINNLASALQYRFELTCQKNDLDESILLARQALELSVRPTPHSSQPLYFNNLAAALRIRYEKTNSYSDWEEAISLTRQALEILPLFHSLRLTSFLNLGQLYLTAYTMSLDTDAPKTHYLEDAMSSFSSAAASTPQTSFLRFRAAQRWALAANMYDHPSAIKAYKTALQTIHEVVSLGLDIRSRQKVLTGSMVEGLARNAASHAICKGDYGTAIEFLDTGRSIVWSQVLQLRSSLKLDDHGGVPSEHLERLKNIAVVLENGSHRESHTIGHLNNQKKMTLDAEAFEFRRLNDEWNKILDQVRAKKCSFLQPPPLSSLEAAANGYPVVFLVPDEGRSHCIVMTLNEVRYIPLSSKMSTTELHKLVYLIQSAASPSGRSLDEQIVADRSSLPSAVADAVDNWLEARLGGRRRVNQTPQSSSDDIFKSVLTTLWNEAVKPIIDLLGLRKSDVPLTRLQWCPTGLFTFLPIHAAGSYDSDSDTGLECASDYFMSSYTPTAGALLASNTPIPVLPTGQLEVLVIADSNLQSTKKEIEAISSRVVGNACKLVQFGTADSPALVESVFSRLPTASIVHFACHGVQERVEPLDSALLLKDGRLTISKIMKQSYPNGSLAFLCACETAMGAANIPDEAMSLGASLLLSGFLNVVATMWKMIDADGPTIAGAFYEELFRDLNGLPSVTPEFTKSARALDIAVKKLKSDGVAFRRWVPFIHFGK